MSKLCFHDYQLHLWQVIPSYLDHEVFRTQSSQRGYNSFETLEFNSEKNAFDFNEINFPSKPSENVSFSKTNPASCIVCHGNPPRPKWDSYRFWPGVCGSDDDFLGTTPRGEIKICDDFWKNSPSHERYKYLIHVVKGDDYETRPNLNLSTQFGMWNARAIAQTMISNPKLYNLRYAVLWATTCHNHYRPSEDVASVAVIEKVIPKKLLKSLKPISVLTKKTPALEMQNLLQRFDRQREIFPEEDLGDSSWLRERLKTGEFPFHETDYDSRLPIWLRFLIEGIGVSIKGWELPFPAGSYDLVTVGRPMDKLNSYLWEKWLDPQTDQKIYSLFEQLMSPKKLNFYDSNKLDAEICNLLETKSRSTLEAQSAELISEAKRAKGTEEFPIMPDEVQNKIARLNQKSGRTLNALGRCIACHATGEVNIPEIPFDDVDYLKRIVRQDTESGKNFLDDIIFRLNTDGPARMPMGGEITPANKEIIVNYLKFLANQK